MKVHFILLLTALSSQVMSEQVYRCTTETGKTVFSQFPCGEDASKVEVEVPSSGISEQEAAERQADYVKALDESSKRLKRSRLENQLQSLIGYRNALEGKRDKKIAALQKKLCEAYDFREQAVIESKIEEAKHEYWSDRRRLNDKIHDIRMELAVCCD